MNQKKIVTASMLACVLFLHETHSMEQTTPLIETVKKIQEKNFCSKEANVSYGQWLSKRKKNIGKLKKIVDACKRGKSTCRFDAVDAQGKSALALACERRRLGVNPGVDFRDYELILIVADLGIPQADLDSIPNLLIYSAPPSDVKKRWYGASSEQFNFLSELHDKHILLIRALIKKAIDQGAKLSGGTPFPIGTRCALNSTCISVEYKNEGPRGKSDDLEPDYELMKILIQGGMPVHEPQESFDPSFPSYTPLQCAIYSSKWDQNALPVLKLMLAQGPNLDVNRQFPLTTRLAFGYLVKSDLKCFPGQSAKITPLDYAIYLDHYEAIKLLLQAGAKITEKSWMIALVFDNSKNLQFLFDEGAQPFASTLLIASGFNAPFARPPAPTQEKRLELVKMLLTKGCPIDCIDSDLDTPLIVASVMPANESLVEYLVPLVKDINHANKKGDTVLSNVCRWKPANISLIKKLIKSGAISKTLLPSVFVALEPDVKYVLEHEKADGISASNAVMPTHMADSFDRYKKYEEEAHQKKLLLQQLTNEAELLAAQKRTLEAQQRAAEAVKVQAEIEALASAHIATTNTSGNSNNSNNTAGSIIGAIGTAVDLASLLFG